MSQQTRAEIRAHKPVIGILQTGQNRAEMTGKFDDYPVLFDRLLRVNGQDSWCEMKTFRVLDGDVPEAVTACDGYIVTGSAAGVYEDHDWMAPLMAFLAQAHSAAVPLLGICFGHQAIAQALGGEVKKWPAGWGVGVRTAKICPATDALPAFMADAPDDFSLIYFHQDQVTRLPEGAVRLATSAFCENSGYTIGNTVLCLQGHPEFEAAYSAALLDAITDKVGVERSAAAKESLQQPTDARLVAGWIKGFFSTALATGNQAA